MLKKSNDWAIALSAVVCSAVLLVALAFGVRGQTVVPHARRLCVLFPDITGIKVSSEVKYAGAVAGTVSAIRILPPEERSRLAPNLIEVTLSISPKVPPLPNDVTVSIASDTLLSDKFILINGGTPSAPPIAAGTPLRGIPPTTFDQVARDVDSALNDLRRALGGGSVPGAGNLMEKADKLLGEASSTLSDLHPVVGEIRSLVADTRTVLVEARVAVADAKSAASGAGSLIADNRERIQRSLQHFEKASESIESLSLRSDALVRRSEGTLTRSLADLEVSLENLKVTSTYSKILLRELARRPSRILWGFGKPQPLPSEQEILNSRQPVP